MDKLTNEELAILAKHDDDAFREIYHRFERLMRYFANKHRDGYQFNVSKEDIISACNYGLFRAVKSFDIEKNIKFSTCCYENMRSTISHEYTYWKRSCRSSLKFKTMSLNEKVEDRDGKLSEAIESFRHPDELDIYFDGEFVQLNDAIKYAVSNTKEKLKPFLIDIIIGTYTQRELVLELEMSQQSIQYYINKFKNDIREYLEHLEWKGMEWY